MTQNRTVYDVTYADVCSKRWIIKFSLLLKQNVKNVFLFFKII